MPPHDTRPVVAIATATGASAVGIVRASGADLAPLVQALFGRPLEPRRATLLRFDEAAGDPIDTGLALYFPAPHSYTGEDVLELQSHGGSVVLQLLLARVLEAGKPIGLRLARPGEFTERAFLNDKLDLAQAEAVADLIEASTEAAARSASRSLAGAFSAEVRRLTDALIELRTLVEATLDFPDEELDFLREADARGRLQGLQASLVRVLERARQGALLREGLRVVLAGQPNVGKSSLLNALAGAELAIVTPIPGTTRDKVSETIQIDGVPMHIIDTAGLREAGGDEVERIGIARSWGEIERADAVLLLRDLTRRGEPAYDTADAAIRARIAPLAGPATLLLDVWNKADLAPAPASALAISALTGEGIDRLRRSLLEHAGWTAQPEGLFIARERHLQALRHCDAALAAAAALLADDAPALELLAEELRAAHHALGEITGAFSTEDLLGAIFGRFCIGK